MQRVVTFDLAAVTAEMKRRPAPLVPPTPRRSQRSRYRSIRRSRAKADRCQRLNVVGALCPESLTRLSSYGWVPQSALFWKWSPSTMTVWPDPSALIETSHTGNPPSCHWV